MLACGAPAELAILISRDIGIGPRGESRAPWVLGYSSFSPNDIFFARSYTKQGRARMWLVRFSATSEQKCFTEAGDQTLKGKDIRQSPRRPRVGRNRIHRGGWRRPRRPAQEGEAETEVREGCRAFKAGLPITVSKN